MAYILRHLVRCRGAPCNWLSMVRPRQTADPTQRSASSRAKVEMAAASMDRRTRSASIVAGVSGQQQGPPSAAASGRKRASKQRSRAAAALEYTGGTITVEEAKAGAQGAAEEQEGSHAETNQRPAEAESKRKRKHTRGKQAAAADAVEVDVTATAKAAAKIAVKRKRGRQTEATNIEIEELLESAEEAVAEEEAAQAKPKRARKKLVKEDDLNAVLVDLPPTVPAGKLVGCHVSAAAGVERALVNAASIGAKAFAMDTRSKRRWECPPLMRVTAAAFREACNAFGFSAAQILPHGSYLINLGSPDKGMLAKSYAAFLEELQRCETLGIRMYNIHPGHSNSCGETSTPEQCMDLIASCINRAHLETSGVTVVLENVAGQGSSVGHSFEQLRYMIDRVEDQARIGVCLDTCHMFAAGYDLTTPAAYASTMQKFSDIVGMQYLKGMHINDSKAALGSRRDRHENVGRGLIGIKMFECIMNDPRLDGIPLIMETPVQEPEPAINYKKSLLAGEVVYRHEGDAAKIGTDKRDIALLYSLCK